MYACIFVNQSLAHAFFVSPSCVYSHRALSVQRSIMLIVQTWKWWCAGEKESQNARCGDWVEPVSKCYDETYWFVSSRLVLVLEKNEKKKKKHWTNKHYALADRKRKNLQYFADFDCIFQLCLRAQVFQSFRLLNHENLDKYHEAKLFGGYGRARTVAGERGTTNAGNNLVYSVQHYSQLRYR